MMMLPRSISRRMSRSESTHFDSGNLSSLVPIATLFCFSSVDFMSIKLNFLGKFFEKNNNFLMSTSPIPRTHQAPIAGVLLRSVVDGPGNRAVVFTQGCNIRCVHCHNPHTQTIFSTYRTEQCDNDEIQKSPSPSPSSPSSSVVFRTAEECWSMISPRKSFISGITCSGGEPM